MKTHAAIVELLRNIGGRKEVEQYLRHYCGVEQRKFAVIVVDGDVVERDRDTVAASLAFLQQVGLSPIVVHGAGPIDGAPVSGDGALDRARKTLGRENLELVEALGRHECSARPVPGDVFEAMPEVDRRGRVSEVDDAPLVAAIRAGQMPILASLGASAGGQILALDTTDAAIALAKHLEPHKLIFLTAEGGLRDGTGRLVSAVNLCEEGEALMASPWLEGRARRRMERIGGWLDAMPPESSVSITSPEHLARELFTHRGAGTLVRRGERVVRVESFDELDRARLRGLLESCFGRALTPDYFETKDCHRAYVTEGYRGAAILTREAGTPYLDKFAVTKKAQGEGLGKSLWSRMRAEHPALFWRAQSNNEVNPWYFQQADGSYRRGRWTVFWCGLDGFAHIERCVEAALALPATLRAHSAAGREEAPA